MDTETKGSRGPSLPPTMHNQKEKNIEHEMETAIIYELLGVIGWILKIMHDPKCSMHLELSYYSIVKSCKVLVSTEA